MNHPKLAICNFLPDVDELKRTALTNGFSGVDWTFTVEDLPTNTFDESRLLRKISRLHPLEVRYHCAFKGVDVGNENPQKAAEARAVFRSVCRLVARLGGRYVTVHHGLGRDSSNGLSWQSTLSALGELVSFAAGLGIRVCLENLASGWSSRPELFEKLVRKSNAGVTLDIGHARVSPSVQNQHYAFEDFITPHQERIFNAHIYHEEWDNGHIPPQTVADLAERLQLLQQAPCDWWVLELREPHALFATLEVVREFLETVPRVALEY